MGITREKSEIFSKIAALRVSSESFPKPNILNSFESISQKTNSLDFLLDLTKALIGFEALKDSLIDVLTHNLDDIELEVKKAIKTALKSLVSCSVNPSLPTSFIQDGITLEVNKIDLVDTFKVVPTSDSGKLLYNDINSGVDSTDFNTYLYNVIQDNGGTSAWGNQTIDSDILDIRFNKLGVSATAPNNTITIKPSSAYVNSTLTDINNDYIDSIKLFETNKLITSIIESIFGTVSLNVGKSKPAIENEVKIQEIIDRILNCDEDEVIDDSFFQFSNQEISNIEAKAEMRRQGKTVVTTCDNVVSRISLESLSRLDSDLDPFYGQMTTPTLIEQKTTIVRNALERLAQEAGENAENENRFTIKVNFIERMLKSIMNAIVGVILSPKLITILVLNHTIVYGESFNTVEEFLKKNKVLIGLVLVRIRELVVSILMERVMREIKTLVSDNVIKTQIERVKNKRAQLASLVGVKTDILRNITGLT